MALARLSSNRITNIHVRAYPQPAELPNERGDSADEIGPTLAGGGHLMSRQRYVYKSPKMYINSQPTKLINQPENGVSIIAVLRLPILLRWCQNKKRSPPTRRSPRPNLPLKDPGGAQKLSSIQWSAKTDYKRIVIAERRSCVSRILQATRRV